MPKNEFSREIYLEREVLMQQRSWKYQLWISAIISDFKLTHPRTNHFSELLNYSCLCSVLMKSLKEHSETARSFISIVMYLVIVGRLADGYKRKKGAIVSRSASRGGGGCCQSWNTRGRRTSDLPQTPSLGCRVARRQAPRIIHFLITVARPSLARRDSGRHFIQTTAVGGGQVTSSAPTPK